MTILLHLKKPSILISLLAALSLSLSGISLYGENGRILKYDTAINSSPRPQDAAHSPQPEWETFETYYFKVYYREGVNLQKLERKLKQRGFFYGKNAVPADASIEIKIGFLLDRLYNRAQELLDMRPKIVRLKIKIYENRAELNEEYRRIFNVRPDYKSFYIHKYTTIYTSAEDVSDSVIIHEMGHAIVDHYFAVIPPPTVGEILASYVDMHLTE